LGYGTEYEKKGEEGSFLQVKIERERSREEFA
jgi:hypothetical protein